MNYVPQMLLLLDGVAIARWHIVMQVELLNEIACLKTRGLPESVETGN